MSSESASLRFATALLVVTFTLDSINYGSASVRKSSGNTIDARQLNVTPMHKALLTQRGYIQFLRWELPVPEIEEFTFCVWVKSTNFSYPHSIFSYSKNEKDRLVRAWISSYGRSVHLEIDNIEIFSHATNIREHRWYHICESWNNADGRYALWIDGQKNIDGYATLMAGHVIPSGGDMVLGQEYTDFDKGLEEGVEGAVLGFNLILSSAFESTGSFFESNKPNDVGPRSDIDLIGYESRLSAPIYSARSYPRVENEHPVFARIPMVALRKAEVPSGLDGSTNISPAFRRIRGDHPSESRTRRKSHFFGDLESDDSFETIPDEKPLGQQLVESSFEHCQRGRGSPRIGGKLMLISWTRTPVKVFGGAIIKNANSDCGNF